MTDGSITRQTGTRVASSQNDILGRMMTTPGCAWYRHVRGYSECSSVDGQVPVFDLSVWIAASQRGPVGAPRSRQRYQVTRFDHMSHPDPAMLRPIERRVLDMHSDGVKVDEIASRIRRSPEFVERLLGWTEIPRTGETSDRHLTPKQQRVLDMRADGETHEEIAEKFKKSERYIRQVEGLAHFKEGQRLLSQA